MFHNLLPEISLVKNSVSTISVNCDNQFMMSVCNNKHFDHKKGYLSIRQSTIGLDTYRMRIRHSNKHYDHKEWIDNF